MAKQWALSGNAENVDWSDTAESGRAYADNLIGEPVISKVMHMMADEIERLRLTDAEREAVEWAARAAAKCSGDWAIAAAHEERFSADVAKHAARAATLRCLLSRIGDCPTPDNAADRDSGPTAAKTAI